ncbi:hypothetical protein FRC06_006613 [Ceratobasidium sp. 370]|nr:hypothetical protein FRC06_006613 [Ceratobasidium sp. 370]
MARKKRSAQNSTTKNMDVDGPSQPVALPFRETRANKAAEKAAKQGKAPPPTSAAPTIERPRRNVPEKTYSAKAGPILVNRNPPIVDPDIPPLPGQEDIPPSPKGVGHVTAACSEGLPGTHFEACSDPEASVEPTSHPFGEPTPQGDSNPSYGEDFFIPPCDAPTNNYFYDANWSSLANSNQTGAFNSVDTGSGLPTLVDATLPSSTSTSYLANPNNSLASTFQSNPTSQFHFAPSDAPTTFPSFLAQLGHAPNSELGHTGTATAAASSSTTQYRIVSTDFQTPTPVRTAPPVQSAPNYPVPSYYPQIQPTAQLLPRAPPSKTPSRKAIQANVVNFICEQRKFRGRGGGLTLADSVSQDARFDLTLRNVMSNVRGDAYTYTHFLVKNTYNVSPKSKTRLTALLKDQNFLYLNEVKASPKEIGLCCHEAVSRVVCALLFDTPAGLGTLYMERLCAVDKPEAWHNQLKDKSADAKRGVPIGLIAFAGTLICHILECVRDYEPSAKTKKHKFEGSHYKKVWTKIRDRLIKYWFLGQLRVNLLQSVKARYNEINGNSDGDNDISSSSDSSTDTEDVDDGVADMNASTGMVDEEVE